MPRLGVLFLTMGSAVIPASMTWADACCLATEGCQDITPAECMERDGYLSGVGIGCADAACEPQGVCIFVLGGDATAGQITTQFQCEYFDGAYYGDGSTIEQGRQPGACVQEDGACSIEEYRDCIGGGKDFKGSGTTCGYGACIAYDSNAITCCEVFEADCRARNQSYLGDGIACSEIDGEVVLAQSGGCCLQSGDCLASLSRNDCLALLGRFDRENATCNRPCPQYIGSCYQSNDVCEVRRLLDCIDRRDGRFNINVLDLDKCNLDPGSPALGYCCTPMNPEPSRVVTGSECRLMTNGTDADVFVLNLEDCTEEKRTTLPTSAPESVIILKTPEGPEVPGAPFCPFVAAPFIALPLMLAFRRRR